VSQVSPRSGPRWLAGRRGDLLAVLWGFAEASLFFIVPDVLITLAAGFSARRGLRHLGLVILGAVAAGMLMFTWSTHFPDAAKKSVASVPFVQSRMFEQVESDYTRAGIWAPCLGPTSAIPYKIYAVLAPEHVSPPAFALVTIPARAERLLITWAQFAVIGYLVRRHARKPAPWIFGIHACYWVLLYVYLWGFN
jgi:hypothetical protein